MKRFSAVAIPHKDILEGRLTMDVFAADLEQVCRNEGPDEDRYKPFIERYSCNPLLS